MRVAAIFLPLDNYKQKLSNDSVSSLGNRGDVTLCAQYSSRCIRVSFLQ